jgi:hypothetical protein
MEGEKILYCDGGDFKAVIMDSSNSLSKTLRFNYVLLSMLAIKTAFDGGGRKILRFFITWKEEIEINLKLRQFEGFEFIGRNF